MKRCLIALIVLIGTGLLSAQTDNQEFRATWVITWDHISASNTVEANKANVRRIMDEHKAANMNAVLWQVRQSGTAYYNSSFEPWGSYAGSSDPGYDPLQYAIEQAHARGMELHAWFNTFHASSTVNGTPAQEHPEWICRDGNGNPMPSSIALSPGLEAVRDYTLNVAMEIVNNYDIDGLHLDYIRWNEYNTDNISTSSALSEMDSRLLELDGYHMENESSLKKVASSNRYLYDVEHPYADGVPSGFSTWEDYWRASVTTFVEALHDSIQTVKPWVRLSAAALGKYKAGGEGGWNGYYVVFQDAALWFNEGSVEQLTPMHYHWTTTTGFTDMLATDWGPNIQAGIAAGRLFSVGPYSWKFGVDNIWTRQSSIVNACRTVSWVDGFQFFSYGDWKDYDYWDEAGASFFGQKTKIRGSGLINNTVPPAPTVQLSTIDPFTFDITITPDGSNSEDQWWAVYRSAADDIDVNTSEIIDTHFGSDPFTVRQAFDGTQNHAGSYFYSATMLDRYWNESPLAESVESPVLESLAPVLLSTYPTSGDTVEASTVLHFEFSKSMNTASTEAALTVSPTIALDALSWSDDDRILDVYPQEKLDYDNSYTVTISDAAQDVNGRALDGDGDGTEGGAFNMTFKTNAADEAGPIIISSYPPLGANTENFDIGETISFVFDEELDPLSLTGDAISFRRSDRELEFDYLLTTADGKSVLDIGLYEPLWPGNSYTITLAETIADTLGNMMGQPVQLSLTAFEKAYSEIRYIDEFIYTGQWWDPEGSGSTVGTVGASTVFGYTSSVYVPGSNIYTQGKKGAYLKYKWDTTAPAHLLREYIPDVVMGTVNPQPAVHFDNSYIFQCYIYGDGSMNKFRICLDEGSGTSFTTGEVSNWVTLDWVGWRLVQWDLSDPTTVGSWIGNQVLEGPEFRIDSFQMTWDPENGAVEGKIYLDQIRVIKRVSAVATDEEIVDQTPSEVHLSQNYPNPFNPETQINFSLPESMEARLAIYDIRGREVATLIDQHLAAGQHHVNFDGSDLAAGVYLLRMETKSATQVRRMLLLK
ncbi:MAG: family 10 glycosylhydrolase [Candidatus Marinimicrobia bacterium]|nr:family 10 glycosylhydrolase [Candidatus Neomarinimicrobiota bacterium]